MHDTPRSPVFEAARRRLAGSVTDIHEVIPLSPGRVVDEADAFHALAAPTKTRGEAAIVLLSSTLRSHEMHAGASNGKAHPTCIPEELVAGKPTGTLTMLAVMIATRILVS